MLTLELEDKKTPYFSVVRNQESKLQLAQKLLPHWITFKVPKGTMQATRRKMTSLVLPRLNPMNNVTNLAGRIYTLM